MSRINASGLGEEAGHPKTYQAPDVHITPDGYEDEEVFEEQEDPNAREHITKLDKINDTLNTIHQSTNQNATLSQLLSDPNINSYLNSKQSGKKGKFVEESNEPTPESDPANEQEPDWEALAQNPREMALHLSKSASRAVEKTVLPKLVNHMKEQLAPLGEMMQQMQMMYKAVTGLQSDKIRGEMDSIRRANPQEFDALKPKMAELLQEYPGMSMTRLYKLAKAEVNPVENTRSIQTERPSSISASRPGGPVTPNMMHRPQRGRNTTFNFDNTLSKLLDNRDFSGLPGVD